MTHKTWWETEGSAMRPFPNEDIEEFAKRITAIAWSNGEYVEREACAEICDDMKPSDATFDKRFFVACTLNAQAIRARGQE